MVKVPSSEVSFLELEKLDSKASLMLVLREEGVDNVDFECVNACVSPEMLEKTWDIYSSSFQPDRFDVHGGRISAGAVWLECLGLCQLKTSPAFLKAVMDPILKSPDDKCIEDTKVTFGGRNCFFASIESDSEIRCLIPPGMSPPL